MKLGMALTILGVGVGNAALSSTSEIQQLPPVIVTATGSATPVLDLPYATESLSAETLQHEYLSRSLPEALREIPSVMVQKTGHGQGSPHIRGFTGFRTLLLIDGVRLNNSVFREGPNQYWNTVDPLTLRQVELVKGPASVLYGSDAIGGTVHARTIEPGLIGNDWDWATRTYYRYSTAEDSHIGRAEVSAGWADGLSVIAGFSPKHFGNLEAGHRTGKLPKTGYDEWDGDAKAVYALGENGRLVAAFQHVDQTDAWRTHRTVFAKSFHGTTVGTDRVHSFDQHRKLAYLQYRVEELPGWLAAAQAGFSYHLQSEDRFRIRSAGQRDTQGFDVQTFGATLQLVSPSLVGRWTYGAEYYRDGVDSYSHTLNSNNVVIGRGIQGPVADNSTYDLAGVYAQDEIALGEAVELILGGRYTWARARAGQARDPLTATRTSLREDWDSVVGSARWLWRVDQARRWSLYAGASQGFRAPNLSDLTSFDIGRSGEQETAAFGLDPEEFLTIEAGVKTAHEKWSGEAAYYRTFIRDLIIRRPTGNLVNGLPEVTKQNAGNGWVHGVELHGRVQLCRPVSLFGWISWIEGEADGFPTSAPVRRREYLTRLMPLSGEVGLRGEWPRPAIWVELLTLLADNQDKLSTGDKADTQRIPPGGTPGYGILTLRGGWRLNERARISVALENILDKDYRVHGSGINGAGRNLIVASEIRF